MLPGKREKSGGVSVMNDDTQRIPGSLRSVNPLNLRVGRFLFSWSSLTKPWKLSMFSLPKSSMPNTMCVHYNTTSTLDTISAVHIDP